MENRNNLDHIFVYGVEEKNWKSSNLQFAASDIAIEPRGIGEKRNLSLSRLYRGRDGVTTLQAGLRDER